MSEINDQIKARLEKLKRVKDMGVNPYPYSYERTHLTSEIVDNFEKLSETEETVKICGRIMVFRKQGKASFANIQDPGGRIQIYCARDIVGVDEYMLFKAMDFGDFIGIEGYAFSTKTGEKSIFVKKFEVLSKSTRPLPIPKEKIGADGKKEVFDQFKDKELRYRQRYVDLVLNEESRKTVLDRSKIMNYVRNYLTDNSYLEVETPVLQSIYGGASARPFITHHNSLDIPLYMRVSNELYLKRLIVGGIERVFEFSRNFRNEGIDRTHSPEFTVLEFYEAYADYNKMMEHFEQLYSGACQAINGSMKFEYDGNEIDLTPPWERLTMKDAIKKFTKIEVDELDDNKLKEVLKEKHIELDGEFLRGKAVQELFETQVEEHLIQPVFIIDHPKESTPLCKVHREDSELIERFEPYINGWEIGNAYSELNDPIRQRELFIEQVERGRGGEDETHPMDEDFLRAMEYGMPPTGGVGIGIDRMVMLLTSSYNIRDVITFPLMRPE